MDQDRTIAVIARRCGSGGDSGGDSGGGGGSDGNSGDGGWFLWRWKRNWWWINEKNATIR